MINDLTYLNPVYSHACPDPFVLKWCSAYWAYCSGTWYDNRRFGILHSPDLVHWQALEGALEPLPGDWPCYWAPEVAYHNGQFYMYYSVGNEDHMHLRVAVAAHPAGPFVDSGQQLTTHQFAIDAHLFTDADGTRYLFYATDFLEHSHMGTGTVRDRLLDPFTLEGKPRPVTRARYDWQVYDPLRQEKGGVRWHTVEGSFVLKHKGHYYHMFSGGNWQNISYGVSYALTDTLDRVDEWEQVADGERVLPILRTVPGQVIGPGHNSVVRGPDNQQLFCVYHRWNSDLSERQMAVDRLDWAGERMLVLGPSFTPQPVPNPPTLAGFANWEVERGRWSVRDGEALQDATHEPANARCPLATACFVAEVSTRALTRPTPGSSWGISVQANNTDVLRCLLTPQHLLVSVHDGDDWHEDRLPLPAAFDPQAFHLLRLEVDHQHVRLQLDDGPVRWNGRIATGPKQLGLVSEHVQSTFAGFSLTVGWENTFERDTELETLGWQSSGDGQWTIVANELRQTDAQAQNALLSKGPVLDHYELVVNACINGDATTTSYGFYAAFLPNDHGPLLRLEHQGDAWVLVAGDQSFALPPTFEPAQYQQFRFRRVGRRLTIHWEAHELGVVDVTEQATQVGLAAYGAVAFDLVRLTALILP